MSGTGGSAAIPGPPGPAGPPGAAGSRVEHAQAVTAADGTATITWPPGAFSGPPVVSVAVEAGAGFRSARIVSNSAAATVVQATAAAVVELLGIQVLGVGTPAAGVTVHALAVSTP